VFESRHLRALGTAFDREARRAIGKRRPPYAQPSSVDEIEMAMKLTDLEIGLYFTYRRRRWLLFRSRTAGLGQIIGLDQEEGVVHVRIFWTPADEGDLREGLDLVAVGHLPIVFSKFLASSPEAVEKHPVPQDCRSSIAAWRARHAQGEVGAFSVPLWEAVNLIWETALESGNGSAEDLFIETAFPKRGPSGGFTVLEVATQPRSMAAVGTKTE